jgi:type I restriction enzyme S subunit
MSLAVTKYMDASGLKPYPEYKDSGIEWIGGIPEHWDIVPIKRVVTTPITDGPHETPDFIDEGVPFISAEAIRNNKIDFSKKRGFISAVDHRRFCLKYKPCKDDIYMIKSGATTGNIAIVETDVEFNIWSPLAAIRIDKQKGSPNFVLHFLNSKEFQISVQLSWSFGTQQNIGMNVIEKLLLAFPPLIEQQIIADFLDRETFRIDTLIEKKQQFIELLGEKRSSLISQVVTKGLNPNVPMKDSGIEWIGEVPGHWSIIKLKYVSYMKGRIGWQNLRQDEYTDKGPYLITGMHFDSGSINWNSCYHITEERYQMAPEIQVKEQDLLITKDGSIGKLAYIKNLPGKASLNSHLLLIRPFGEKFVNRYMYYLMLSNIFSLYSLMNQTGTTFNGITQNSMENFDAPFPHIQEQHSIADFLDLETSRIDTLTEKIKQSINYLKEYRTALISSAVTGKIDVRGTVSD